MREARSGDDDRIGPCLFVLLPARLCCLVNVGRAPSGDFASDSLNFGPQAGVACPVSAVVGEGNSETFSRQLLQSEKAILIDYVADALEKQVKTVILSGKQVSQTNSHKIPYLGHAPCRSNQGHFKATAAASPATQEVRRIRVLRRRS